MEPETAAPEPEAAAQTVPLDDSIKPKNPSVTLNMQAATTALTQSTAQAEVTRLGTLNTLGTNERGRHTLTLPHVFRLFSLCVQ